MTNVRVGGLNRLACVLSVAFLFGCQPSDSPSSPEQASVAPPALIQLPDVVVRNGDAGYVLDWLPDLEIESGVQARLLIHFVIDELPLDIESYRIDVLDGQTRMINNAVGNAQPRNADGKIPAVCFMPGFPEPGGYQLIWTVNARDRETGEDVTVKGTSSLQIKP